jgi:hypothetical protein
LIEKKNFENLIFSTAVLLKLGFKLGFTDAPQRRFKCDASQFKIVKESAPRVNHSIET